MNEKRLFRELEPKDEAYLFLLYMRNANLTKEQKEYSVKMWNEYAKGEKNG